MERCKLDVELKEEEFRLDTSRLEVLSIYLLTQNDCI
jgi:hypothetical protein